MAVHRTYRQWCLVQVLVVLIALLSLTACGKISEPAIDKFKEWVIEPWQSKEEEPIDYTKLGHWTRYRVLHAMDNQDEIQVSLLQIDYTRDETSSILTLTQYPIHWKRNERTQAINYRIMRTSPTPPRIEKANDHDAIEKLAVKAEKYIEEGVTKSEVDGKVMAILGGSGDDDGDAEGS